MKISDKFATSFTRLILKHRLIMLTLVVSLAVGMGYGAKNLTFSTNYRVFFDEKNPQLMAFENLQNIYSKSDSIIFVVKAKNGTVFQPRILEAIQKITEKGWYVPFASRVDSITNFQHTHSKNDDLIVEDLIEGSPFKITSQELLAKQKIAVNEPLLVDRAISPDATTTGIMVTLQFQEKDPFEVPQAAKVADEILKEIQAEYPGIELAMSGITMMNNSFMGESMSDMTTLIPLMYIMLLVGLMIFLRSIWGMVITTLIMLFSAAVGMGFGGWAGMPLTPTSASAPTIIMTLAIADTVHILVTFFREMCRGKSKDEAIIESMRINMSPIFLTSLTTAIGFLTLNFSESPPFHHLGNMTAAGVLAAFLLSITLVPVLASLLPIKCKQVEDVSKKEIMHHFADFVINYRKILMIGMVAIVVSLGALIPRIELNDEFVKYFDKTVQFRQDTDFMRDNLTGVYNAEYSLGANGAEGVNDPEYLENLEKFKLWLEEQPEVLHAYAMTDIYKRLNKNMHNDDESYYRLPENRQMAAQFLLLYEMSLPVGLDITDRVNIDKSATRLTATLDNISTKEMRIFKVRSEQWLRENTPSYMHTEASSPNLMFAYISYNNAKSMLKGNIIAFFLISVIIGLSLRSVKMGLYSIVPNIVPAIMAFGIWAIFSGQINMAASIVIAVSLGIIVDDTVHFLSKYHRGRTEKGFDATESVRYAFESVGMALLVTSGVLIIGFGVLILSHFAMNDVMGILTTITIACALLADFLLLPAMLIWLDKGDSFKKNQ